MPKELQKQRITAPSHLNEPIEYGKSFSRGIKTKIGKTTLISISGTASIDKKGKTVHKNDFTKQVEKTYSNLTALLQSAGATWHNVIKTRCYLKDMKYYPEFNEYRNKFYKKQNLNPFPASVGIQITLCRPELLIEIELTAAISSKTP